VGISTGLGAIIFVWLIAQFRLLFFELIQTRLALWVGILAVVFIPMLGGLLAGPIIDKFAKEAKGHGVPEVMKAIALRGGRIAPQVVIIKALASAACIGSGGSAGREGPIVQIGSAIGSVVGQLFRLSDQRIRNLVACGAAAGIAAVFNAPIAGTIFAMEVILGEFTTAYFGSVVICAVAASITSRQFLGDNPAFRVPSYTLMSPWELLFYAILGFLAAIVAWLFVTTLYWFEDLFDNWQFPSALKPAAGGLLLGILALFTPQVMGSGLEFIEQAIRGDLSVAWQFMALLVLAKILATGFTLGSGNSGGIFAPSLFMGATLGGAFGGPLHQLLPAITAQPGAYALVGMAAVFAAATHAPITAIMTVFEMSGDYRLILPLMLATVISTLISERLRADNIYTLKLRRRGINLQAGRVADIMQGITVQDAMERQFITVPATMPIGDLLAEFKKSNRRGLPVVDHQNNLAGIVTVQDLDRAFEQGVSGDMPIQTIATTDLLVAYPNETLADALRRLNTRDIERLPVVSRNNPRQIIGLIRRRDIIRAYNIALTDRAKIQHRLDQLKLRNLDHTEFVEVDITPGAICVNKTLSDLALQLPHEAVIISVRRDSGQVDIAHGNTKFLPGDRVVAFIHSDSKAALYKTLLGVSAPTSWKA
jgi:CIC family chloride channel protein